MKLIITPEPKKITHFLYKIVAIVILIGLLTSFAKNIFNLPGNSAIVRFFNLNGEANIPSLYSASAIWFCSALIWFIYKEEKKLQNKGAAFWKWLCFVFIFLGFDELLAIHEKTKSIAIFFSNYIQLPKMYLYWTILYGILLLFFAIYFFRFYFSLKKITRIRFTIAGIVFVGGAVGMEILGGLYEKRILGGGLYDTQVGFEAFGMGIIIAIEEGMEMVGIVLFIRALLYHICTLNSYPVLIIDFKIKSKSEHKNQLQRTLER